MKGLNEKMAIYVDAHVHIYSCFDLNVFFDAAHANFRRQAAKQDPDRPFTAVLFLTDWAQQRWFQHFALCARNAGGNAPGIDGWTFHPTAEKNSLLVRHPSGKELVLIAGRKIITSEVLEILALFAMSPFQDGVPFKSVLRIIEETGGLAVLPWAPGKWMGKRGALIKKLLEGTTEPRYFLCDNANRPVFWRRPALLSLGESKGLGILSGSDPLHFASEVRRAGNAGFRLEGSLDPQRPAHCLKQMLLNRRGPFRLYGSLETPWRFFRNQLAMQALKRLRRRQLVRP